MQAVADHREEFEFTDHCSGPNMNATPQQIIERIERYSHVLLGAAFARPELQDVIKWHSKYARQNGIHVSPTLWSMAWCSRIWAAAMMSACGPRGLWPEVTCYTFCTSTKRQTSMSEQNYQPPKVWEWKQNSGGAFANINRPVSGATHERVLPVGTHPLQLYSLGTPNGQKVTIMLEELLALGVSGAEYDAWLIRIGEGGSVFQRLCRYQPELEDPGPQRPLHHAADPGI